MASAQSVASAQAVSGNGPQARLAESLMGQRNENPSLEKRGGGIKGVLLILCHQLCHVTDSHNDLSGQVFSRNVVKKWKSQSQIQSAGRDLRGHLPMSPHSTD